MKACADSLFARTLTAGGLIGYGTAAVAAFHLAYSLPGTGVFMLVFLFCAAQLARAETPRRAFYPGLAIGVAAYGPQSAFFYNIFGFGAGALWLVLAFWLGLFAALARLCLKRLGPLAAAVILPFVWTGLEYFRGEIYHLKFSWLSAGGAFSASPVPLSVAGLYGIGFLLMAVVGVLCVLPRKMAMLAASLTLAALCLVSQLPAHVRTVSAQAPSLRVAGLQMEAPMESDLIKGLDGLVAQHPETDLVLLSEYCFQSPPPGYVLNWCRQNKKHLVAGGKDFVSETAFFDTAFVVSPEGKIVFRQAKSVPIQFFKDGLPALDQKVWDSPWGKLGICICYDLSSRRVIDRLVTLGAQGLLVPTMDELSWGRQEHIHHARVAPTRAAELGVPILRIGSCGIPQLVDAGGHVQATAFFPKDGAVTTGVMRLSAKGRLPFDHWAAPLSLAATLIFCLGFCLGRPQKTEPACVSPDDSPEVAAIHKHHPAPSS